MGGLERNRSLEQTADVPVAVPICPCCKRPDAAALEQAVQGNRLVAMWQCSECHASWGYRPGIKAS
jgi:hypothetical protein